MITDWTIINRYEMASITQRDGVAKMQDDISKGIINSESEAGRSAIEYTARYVGSFDSFTATIAFKA